MTNILYHEKRRILLIFQLITPFLAVKVGKRGFVPRERFPLAPRFSFYVDSGFS
jgi:hypothetical protein